MVSIFVRIPIWSNLFINDFGTVPKAPITIEITVTFLFYSICSSLAKYYYQYYYYYCYYYYYYLSIVNYKSYEGGLKNEVSFIVPTNFGEDYCCAGSLKIQGWSMVVLIVGVRYQETPILLENLLTAVFLEHDTHCWGEVRCLSNKNMATYQTVSDHRF